MSIDIFENYKLVAKRMLSHSFPTLTSIELDEAINYSVELRKQDHPATIDNNYKKKQVEMTLQKILEYIIDRKPIVTHYGVLFSRHGSVPNPMYDMIQKFIDNRTVHKNQMFKYPKGSELFARYHLLQILDKQDANGMYGAIGKFSCLFYNLYVASTITTEGRNLNAAAALLFESILNNNVPFASLNEVIHFIDNTCNQTRYFDDKEILDRDISINDAFAHIILSCGFEYIPDEKDMQIIWDILLDLSQTDINRLYYKNNLFAFVDENTSVTQSILYMLQKLEAPFMNPNKPPEIIKEEIKIFNSLLLEYVYYDHHIIDRTEKMESLIRSISVIQDTDVKCII